MRLITDYRHSRNNGKPLRSALVGPKTFQKAKRSWFIKVLIELPCEVGAPQRPAEQITFDTAVMPYSSAVTFARAKLASALIEHDDWTDFTWQVWAR